MNAQGALFGVEADRILKVLGAAVCFQQGDGQCGSVFFAAVCQSPRANQYVQLDSHVCEQAFALLYIVALLCIPTALVS